MVEYEYHIDNIFQSLADSTRRDILRRVYQSELTISGLAIDYDMSFAAVAKHLNVLENAKLIIKKKRGKERVIVPNFDPIKEAMDHLADYKRLWNERNNASAELVE